MNKFLVSFVAGAMLAAVSVTGVLASAPSSLVSSERVTSAGPLSFQMFCALNPNECLPGGASKIQLTQDVLSAMSQINNRVNRAIRPRVDSAAMQVWNINPRTGDCKSYAISKRHELIDAGLPASALRIAFVKTKDGVGHAVLVVKTTQGDVALDNLTNDIKLLRDTGHRVVAMSGSDPRRWS